jgi:TRAP-type C4-dicarboxylate transport system permease small subunit
VSAIGRSLRGVQRGIGRLSMLMGALGTVCIVLITVATLAEVFLRYVFGRSLLGVIEFVELLVAFIFFSLLSYTQLRKGHLRLTLFIDRLPQRVILPLETVVLLLILSFIGLMVWQAWTEAIISTERQQVRFGAVPYPIWPAKLAAAAAVSVMGLQVLADFADRLAAAVTGERPATPLGRPTAEADEV